MKSAGDECLPVLGEGRRKKLYQSVKDLEESEIVKALSISNVNSKHVEDLAAMVRYKSGRFCLPRSVKF